MSAPIRLDALFQRLADAGSPAVTVVTPNRRLATWLERAYDQSRLDAGLKTWHRPDILSLSAFVEREWRIATTRIPHPPARLLTDHAAQALWESLVRESMDAGTSLLNPAKTAREARSAWQISLAWRISSTDDSEPLGDDAQMFRVWRKRFEDRCADLGVVAAPALPDALAQAVGEVPGAFRGRTLIAFEFDLPTFQQDALWRALKQAGATVVPHHRERVPAQSVARHVFATSAEEHAACACWVRAQLERTPGASIGVVAPDLARIKAPLARALAGALSPARLLQPGVDGPCDPGLVNFSLGEALGDHAMVRDALQLLAASCAPAEPAQAARWSALLRTPWISGAESEASARAQLDAQVLPVLPIELNFTQWHAALAHPSVARKSPPCPAWFSAVRAAREAAQGPARRPAAGWATAFGGILRAWGFPGERPLDSTTYQVLGAFQSALGELTRAGVDKPRWSAGEALSVLRQIVADVPFQAESPAARPSVEVLGVLESAGLEFDALWVMGLDEDHWPLAARMHPFLPRLAQRRLPIPETSRDASFAVDQRLSQAWCAAGRHVVFSHANRMEDGAEERELNASVLVRDIPESVFPLALETPIAAAIARSVACEAVEDEPPPALAEGTRVRGGATVLRDQAACPFRAFALHRLGAAPLDRPRARPDAISRGNVLHRALSLLWRELEDRAGLERADLRECIARAADTALAESAESHPLNFPGRLAELERERLMRVLEAWVDLERTRAEFSVTGNEISRQVAVAGLSMKLRLDRVDRLHDGSHALIDYKSGDARPSAWLGDRPDEPQLPLYYATSDEKVAAVAFARVKRGRSLGFAGVAAEDSLLPGVKPVAAQSSLRKSGYGSWEVLTSSWNATVARLAQAFMQGDADVDPKGAGLACQRCDLHALCRIAELQDTRAESETAEEEP